MRRLRFARGGVGAVPIARCRPSGEKATAWTVPPCTGWIFATCWRSTSTITA